MHQLANPLVIPQLESHCRSWVATRKKDGSVIGEFFERSNLRTLNPETVRVETAAQYLVRFNAEVKKAGAVAYH